MELGEVYVKIGADTKPLSTGLAQARGQVKKTSEQMRAQMKTLGIGMLAAGAVITAAFGMAVKAAIEEQKELAQVSTMLDEVSMKYMPKFAEALDRMSIQFGESSATLSRGLYDILSASIDAGKALDVLEVAATAATAGITDTGVAADAITTILNSYGFSADRAGEVSDKLFAVVKRGKLTFNELAPAIGKVASMAAKTNLSFEELGAMIATLTRAGIRTDEAMTSINGVLRAFLKPTDEARDAARAFGLEMNTTTIGSIGLTGAMDKLRGATAEQLAQIFPNIRGLKGLIAALGDAEGYTKDYELMLNSAGLTQEAFTKQSATLGFKIGQLKEGFKVIADTIGAVLIPVVQDVVERVMALVLKMKEWMDAHPGLTKAIVLLGAALGVLTGAGGVLILGALYFTNLKTAMIGVQGTSKLLIPALGKLKIALNSLGGVALLAGANIIIWLEVWKEWKKITEMTKTTQEDVTKALVRLSNAQLVAAEKMGISVQEFVKMQKEGKTVTEMMDTLANRFPGYTDALNVWTMAAVEQQVNAKLIVTTVKDLTQEMSLLTKEYSASSQAISENITYYNDMIDLLNRTDVILQTELMLLEKGTEEWYKKKEEIADNTRVLNEMNEALAKLVEPLEGLELIAAKMALLGESSEDTKAKIELLNEKAVLLQQALDEAIPDTEAWWEAKLAFEGNQTAIEGLKEKLTELTEEEKEAIRQAELLADAYKSITDKIYELTHTPMENAIYKLDQQKQAYLDLGVAIDIVNKWYDASIAKLGESNVALDEHKDKLVEATEATEQLGILGGKAWENFSIQIKHATTTLSTFTKEGVAAAIATIKMHFKPLLDTLVDDINNLTGVWKAMAEANLASLTKSMNDQIAVIKYGYEEYLKILESMEKAGGGVVGGGAGGGGGFSSYQQGTPYVPETGAYLLHKGEAVIPATNAVAGAINKIGIDFEIIIKPLLVIIESINKLNNIIASIGNKIIQAVVKSEMGRISPAEMSRIPPAKVIPTEISQKIERKIKELETAKQDLMKKLLSKELPEEAAKELVKIINEIKEKQLNFMKELKAMSGATTASSYQMGTPYVPKTGLALVHKGERIIPANQNITNTFSPTFNMTVQGGGSPNRIAQEVERVLYDTGRQFKRRGFEIIPGRG